MDEQTKPAVYFNAALFWSKLALRGIRRLKGAARVTGISVSYLGQITRGATPPDATRAKIASALGVEENELWKPVAQTRAA